MPDAKQLLKELGSGPDAFRTSANYLDDGASQVALAEGSTGTGLRHLGRVLSVGNFVLSSHYTSPRRRLSRSSRCSRLLAGLKGGSPIVTIGGMRMCCAAGS